VITPSHIAIYRLAAGRAIAVTGFEAGWIALMVTVYAKTHSTVWMSAALFVAIGTSGIATPIAGALGDRYDRRRVMIISELAAAACATAMAFTDRPGPLVALAALVGLAEAPFLPASNAAVPNLVADDRLEWANSTLAVGRNVGQMVGPLIGGLLTALIAPSAVFAVGAVGFLISAALVWSVSGRFHAEPAAQRQEHGGELRAGFVFVWHSPVLRGIRLTGFYDGDNYIKSDEKTRAIFEATFEHKYLSAGYDYLHATDQINAAAAVVKSAGYSFWFTPKSTVGVEGLFRYDHYTPNDSFDDRTRHRTIVGVAYWFKHQGAVSTALMLDYDGANFDKLVPPAPKQNKIALHALVNF